MTTTIDWGDGTDPVSGPGTGHASPHRYASPGTYLVRVDASDGKVSTVRTARVVVTLSEPITAAAGDDRSAIAGQAVSFNGSGSRPSGVIGEYDWDFGDGTGVSGLSVTHSYPTPGSYTVTLRVHAGAQTAVDTALVTVEPIPKTPGLDVHVSADGSSLLGAEATIVDPSGQRRTAITGADGHAVLGGLPDGDTTVYVWADGFRPVAQQATVTGGSGSIEVALTSGDVGAAVLDSHRLTQDEIVAKGIDPADPANQNVFEFTINLYFVPLDASGTTPQPVPVSLVFNTNRVVAVTALGDPGSGGGGLCAPLCSFTVVARRSYPPCTT